MQLRRRRHELRLRRVDVAAMLGCDWKSLMWWEQDARAPFARSYPAIVQFLGREPWPVPTTLSERLLAERRCRGFTIQEAADAAGVDSATYGRWESGEWKPTRRTIGKLDAFLELHVRERFPADVR
jgi:transcriptional regulator with XRE-family HTH domain